MQSVPFGWIMMTRFRCQYMEWQIYKFQVIYGIAHDRVLSWFERGNYYCEKPMTKLTERSACLARSSHRSESLPSALILLSELVAVYGTFNGTLNKRLLFVRTLRFDPFFSRIVFHPFLKPTNEDCI